MKTYEEVAKSVFEKSEKYFEEKALRAKHIKTAATAMSCFCLAVVLTVVAVAALNSNLTEYSAGSAWQPAENNDIPEYTTTAIYNEATATMPEIATDENGNPMIIPDTSAPDHIAPDHIWDDPSEVFSTVGGVNVPFFIAFDGALYVSYDSGEGGFYEPTGLEAYLGELFSCKVCTVQGRPNHIGVEINSFIHEYKKLFDCDFDIDGTKFQIAYNALKDIDHACGDIVLETDDFTVYEAVRLQGESSDTKEYIVDLLPSLQREFPNLFDELRECGFDDYGDAWWIALSNMDIPDEEPCSLPLNGSDTDTHDTDTHHSDTHDTNTHDTNTHDTNTHDTNTHDTNTHDTNTHETDTHDTNTHDTNTHETDTHETDTHDTNTHETNIHDTNTHETDTHETDTHHSDTHH